MKKYRNLILFFLIMPILIGGFFLPITNIFVTFSSIIFNLDLIYALSESLISYHILLFETNHAPSNVLSSPDSLVSNDEVSHWSEDISFVILEASVAFLAIPNQILSTLRKVIERYVSWKQHLYNSVTLYALENRIFGPIVRVFHILLLYFRYCCIKFGVLLEKFLDLKTFAIIISIICTRFHIAGYLIIACLLFIRLDSAVVNMCQFYKKHPLVLQKHLPKAYISTRGMWGSARKIVEEAATNPQVQAVAVAVAGAVAWKALDVYDTLKQQDISEADRHAESQQRDKDRESEERQREYDRESEERQRERDRENEERQRERDRESEERQRERDRESEERQREKDRETEEREREKDRQSAERIALLEHKDKQT